MGRGALTEAVQQKAVEILGREISMRELRLMPYVQHCLMNEQNIDPRRVNQEEREVMTEWRKAGWMAGGAVDLEVSKEFWGAMHEILWVGYVDYEVKA